MGWREADFKTDLNYFYTKDEQINRGEGSSDPNTSGPETETLVCIDVTLSGRGQGLLVPSPVQPAAAPQLLHTQTTAGCEHEDNPACSSFLYLEFGTQRICISTTLLIQGLK